MKKYKIGILAGLSLIAGIPALAFAYASYFSTNSLTATVFMTPGTATTTLTLAANDFGGTESNKDVDENYIFVTLTGSTSPARVNWSYEFSLNGSDWFGEDAVSDTIGNGIVSNASPIMHASTTIVHSWQPGSTSASTSRKVIKLPNIASNYKRVVFSLPIGGVNASLNVSSSNKRNSGQ